ncbi:hypothetical protein RSOL_372460 [Rhizoctonia solani AG-3 Rhs1AP]|uniref:Uncharacterized protein n=1 Tax=Rhizoctonia solani AG-3 Rhs1AP TaxID=1086054 RepID=X8JC72_9AGAM|nr:hypothetical protein RSOL_372460 [Rhizoctonia solani AG-3 Rhs1AP]
MPNANKQLGVVLSKSIGKLLAAPGSFAINSLNRVLGSIANSRARAPHIMRFAEGWRKGVMEEWYKQQPTTKFKYLEYRKEREAPFYHEYILVHLVNETVCRFDRRGNTNYRANVLVGKPIPPEDTVHVISKDDRDFYPDIENHSDLLLRMYFPRGQDILIILGICYGIQSTKVTKDFSLTRYNGNFSSWMVITATARYTVDWATLAQENQLWEALVTSVMDGLEGPVVSGLLGDPKSTVGATPPLNEWTGALLPTRFIGSSYLCSALREVLVESREQIRKCLEELLILSTVDRAVHDIAEAIALKAGHRAARNHATHAARDAAMEAVIEAMWQDIIASREGRDLWERNCQLAEECVRDASAATVGVQLIPGYELTSVASLSLASNTSLSQSAARGLQPRSSLPAWEAAWETAWEKSWALGNELGGTSSHSHRDCKAHSMKSSVSYRAKLAWINAWDDSCKANEQYVPLFARGVADYVTKNLPEALPEAINNIVNGLIPSKFEGCTNARLQDWVKVRIQEQCARVSRVTAGVQQPNQLEFEETMKEVWESAIRCLSDPGIGLASSA